MPNDVLRGVIKIDNFLEGKCFVSWKDFVLALPQMLTVEVPTTVTNVTVGTTQPGDDQRDNLWIRRDNSGSFLGMFLYVNGAWRQIYPAPGELIYMTGDSRNVPEGYQLMTDSTSFSAVQITAAKHIWAVGGAGPPVWYSSFHVSYVGF